MGNKTAGPRARAPKGGAAQPKVFTTASEGGAATSEVVSVASEGGVVASEVVAIASGADAYTINLTDDNKLGGGNYADVYKIQKKDS